jgi:hypothetical protein
VPSRQVGAIACTICGGRLDPDENGAILAAMPITAHQRRNLLHFGRRRDAEALADAINRLLRDNPDVDLLEVETVLRAATTPAFVIAGEPFKVVMGFRAWRDALTKAGVTPEQNRQALAGHTATA